MAPAWKKYSGLKGFVFTERRKSFESGGAVVHAGMTQAVINGLKTA